MKKKLNFWLVLAVIALIVAVFLLFYRPAKEELPQYLHVYGRDEDFAEWATRIAEMTDPVIKSTQQAVFAEFSVLATNSLRLARTQQAMGCFDNFEAIGCVELNQSVTYGIRNDLGQGRVPTGMKPVNGWIGKVNGEGMSVQVGYYLEDPSQGFVFVHTEISGKTFLLILPTPQKVGALRIEEVFGNRLVLSATESDQPLYFDVLALNFVDDLTSIVPTATPRPTYPPQPDTGPTASPDGNYYPFGGH